MIRKSTLRAKPARRKKKKTAKQKMSLADARNLVAGLKAPNPQAAKVLALLNEWLADESGYDEETWPLLKEALNGERERVGARRLFDD